MKTKNCQYVDYHGLADRFAAWRAFHGLTYRDCAAICGLSGTTLSDVERKRKPSIEHRTARDIRVMMEMLP